QDRVRERLGVQFVQLPVPELPPPLAVLAIDSHRRMVPRFAGAARRSATRSVAPPSLLASSARRSPPPRPRLPASLCLGPSLVRAHDRTECGRGERELS